MRIGLTITKVGNTIGVISEGCIIPHGVVFYHEIATGYFASLEGGTHTIAERGRLVLGTQNSRSVIHLRSKAEASALWVRYQMLLTEFANKESAEMIITKATEGFTRHLTIRQ